MFIQKGANVDVENNNGETPLYKAIFNNSVRTLLMEGLINAGANVNHLNSRKEGVLHYAVRMGRFDLTKIILQAGSKLTVKGQEGKTPLELAKEYKFVKIAKYLDKVQELYEWMEKNDLSSFSTLFFKNELTLSLVEDLDEDSLDNMGIKSVEKKKKILAACKRRKEERTQPPSARLQSKPSTRFPDAEDEQKANLDSIRAHLSADKIVPGKDLEFVKKLGSGVAGEVFKGLYKGQTVAIKVLKSHMAEDLEEFKKEFYVMSAINDDHVVLFIGVSLVPKLCMVMEYCARGSLYHILRDPQVDIDWERTFSFANQIALGLIALHTNDPQVLHRDIKSLNLLITRDWKLKVGDFGTSRFSEKENMDTMRQMRGTMHYLDPRMATGATFTDKSDMYSMGIVLWEIVNRCITGTYAQPYHELKLNHNFQVLYQALNNNARPTMPKQCPKPMETLIKDCWDLNPDVRPSATQSLERLDQLHKEYELHKSEWDTALKLKRTKSAMFD